MHVFIGNTRKLNLSTAGLEKITLQMSAPCQKKKKKKPPISFFLSCQTQTDHYWLEIAESISSLKKIHGKSYQVKLVI